MTFTQIVTRVMERANLTSTAAQTRIGTEVNEVYREFVSSMGMETSIRGETTTLSVNGSRYVTFGGSGEDDDHVIKLLSVYLPTSIAPPPYNVLISTTFDELRNTIPGTWPPQRYAISKMNPQSVEIFLDCTATDNVSVLNADCELASATMSGTDQPNFPENFHDIVIYGVLAIEFDIMEKPDRVKWANAKYEQRSSELRMFIAKDAYIRIHQGKSEANWVGGIVGVN